MLMVFTSISCSLVQRKLFTRVPECFGNEAKTYPIQCKHGLGQDVSLLMILNALESLTPPPLSLSLSLELTNRSNRTNKKRSKF